MIIKAGFELMQKLIKLNKGLVSIIFLIFSLSSLFGLFISSIPPKLVLFIFGGLCFITSIVFFILFLKTMMKRKVIYDEVMKFVSPLKERYGGEVFTKNSEFPYYYKGLRKKNNLFVSFTKNIDNSIIMKISITIQHNFNLRLTRDIAYDMLGEKLFEAYAAKYEEDSVERKLRQRIRGHKNISKFLLAKDRLSIVERLLNAGFDIEFDFFNINIKKDPVNIKDNYYLFRGVEAIIELAGLDTLLMENIPEVIDENIVNTIDTKQLGSKDKKKSRGRKKKIKKEEESEEILYYGPVISLIGMINDSRLFTEHGVNFKIPPNSNHTYIINNLKKEVYQNFTGKYIPIGSILKSLIKNEFTKVNKPTNKVAADDNTDTHDDSTHKVEITTSKGRISIMDNLCSLSLKELLLTVFYPFYGGIKNEHKKCLLYSPFVSVFRYAFTDSKNFRFAFSTSNGKNCYEIVFYAKNPRVRDLYVIVKKFDKRPLGSTIKIKWDMLYPMNVRKYIKHKFINAVDENNKLVIDGHNLVNKKLSKEKEIKNVNKNINIFKKDGSKFIINIDPEKDKKRLKLYSDGILIKQLNNIPWDIKIDLPPSVELIKNLSDFKRSENYNSMIRMFFDYFSSKLKDSGADKQTIIDGVAKLSMELVENTEELKPVLQRIKTDLFSDKDYFCDVYELESIKNFFGDAIEPRIQVLESGYSKLLWANVLSNAKKLFDNEVIVLDQGINKGELKNNSTFKELPEECKTLISYHLVKSPFKGRIIIVKLKNYPGKYPFCAVDSNLYLNIDSPVLKENCEDNPMFKYVLITSLLKGCGLNEKDIEREVLLC